MLATFGQFERRLIGQRTKEALAAKKAAGVRLGRPPTVPQAVVRCIQRQPVRGDSFKAIANSLNRDEGPTSQGGKEWYAATVRHILLRTSWSACSGEGGRPALPREALRSLGARPGRAGRLIARGLLTGFLVCA